MTQIEQLPEGTQKQQLLQELSNIILQSTPKSPSQEVTQHSTLPTTSVETTTEANNMTSTPIANQEIIAERKQKKQWP